MKVQFGSTTYLGLDLIDVAEMAEMDADLDVTGVPHELISELYAAGRWWDPEIRRRPGVVRLIELLRLGTVRPIIYSDSNYWLESGYGRYPVVSSTAHTVLKNLVNETWTRRDSTPLQELPAVLLGAISDVASGYITDWGRVVSLCEWGRGNYLFTSPTTKTERPMYLMSNIKHTVLCGNYTEVISAKETGIPYGWDVLVYDFEKLRHRLQLLSYTDYAAVAVSIQRGYLNPREDTKDCVLLTGPRDKVEEVAQRIRSSR